MCVHSVCPSALAQSGSPERMELQDREVMAAGLGTGAAVPGDAVAAPQSSARGWAPRSVPPAVPQRWHTGTARGPGAGGSQLVSAAALGGSGQPLPGKGRNKIVTSLADPTPWQGWCKGPWSLSLSQSLSPTATPRGAAAPWHRQQTGNSCPALLINLLTRNF